MNISSLRKPSGWLPIATSIAAFALVVGHVALYGAVRDPAEGTPAHIFQMLLAGQLSIVAFFAIKWLPKTPGPVLVVLALQGAAGLAALAPVFYFGL